MKKYELKYLLLWSCMLLLAACGKSEWEENALLDKEGTSLKLTFKSAENRLLTRGIEDLNDDGNVSDAELCLDGRRMYRLGVFLANSEGEVVASTTLGENDTRFSNNNTEAEVEFNNLEYNHLDSNETYTLYAVANYGNSGTLTGHIPTITEDNVTDNLRVEASSDNICNRSEVYPLSFKKGNISLQPGKNTVSGVLSRTYARLRIGVRNQSTEKKLTVTGLGFPHNFVQSEADLFAEGGTANVAPTVTSEYAITPFQRNVVVPKKDASGNVTEVAIFDSYLLESNGGTYEYDLDLKMESEVGYKIKGNKEEIRDQNNVNGNGKGPYYVIYNIESGTYLYANASTKKVELGTSYGTDGAIDPNYVWKFERASTDASIFPFYIESMGIPGYYMQGGSYQDPLSLSTDYNYLQIRTHANKLIFFKNGYYLNVDNNRVYWHTQELTGNETIQQFLFYDVDALQQSIGSTEVYNGTIPIRIDGKDLTAIKRNDFINIVVNVSYDEGSRQASPRIVVEY